MSIDDEIFKLHSKGKISIKSTIKIESRETLSKIYTPGVGKVCEEIKNNPEKVKELTIAGKTIAVISDGSAVLGFGNIGAKAALPVMEGKCVIFKELADIDAFPICLEASDPDNIIEIIKAISVNFAAINLEDIAAPKCFEIEEKLQQILDIPVMHDDQHGTAIVTLAALKGALKLTGKNSVRIVITGAGAAGTAIAKLLIEASKSGDFEIGNIKIHDSSGLICQERKDLNLSKSELVSLTNQEQFETLEESLNNADVFIGVSGPGILTKEMVKKMNVDPIIFALANPTPEIMPDEAGEAGAKLIATGRSDFPNQINNALAYPGVFKGLLGSKRKIADTSVKLTAAEAIYNYNLANLDYENLLPSILDKKLPVKIAEAIKLIR